MRAILLTLAAIFGAISAGIFAYLFFIKAREAVRAVRRRAIRRP